VKGGRSRTNLGPRGRVPSLHGEGPLAWLWRGPAGFARNPPFIGEGVAPVLKHGPRSAGCMQGERILSLWTAMNVII